MSSTISKEPPRVTTRPSGWPVRRMPRWAPAGRRRVPGGRRRSRARAQAITGRARQRHARLPAGGDLGHRVLRGRRRRVTDGPATRSRREHFSNAADVSAGISVAQQGAANCAPANNEQIDDLENYQVPESLDGFGLVAAVTALVAWAAPDAEQVQTDVAQVLAATTPAARSQGPGGPGPGAAQAGRPARGGRPHADEGDQGTVPALVSAAPARLARQGARPPQAGGYRKG